MQSRSEGQKFNFHSYFLEIAAYLRGVWQRITEIGRARP
jgi:hypothetical protein